MRKFFTRLFVIAFFVLLPYPTQASEDSSAKHILDNGLTVLVTEMPSSPVVSVYALIKTGSATEGKFLGTGISHFLEHMLFKGTHQRGVGELASRIQSVGGSINASTGMDYTIYTITVPQESFDIGLAILSDMVMNATMDPDEVELERDVILSEMRMRNDNPDRRMGELTFNNVYIQHPYRHPIIGYKSLFEQVTREDLLEYYRTFYVPNNMVLSVVGNIKAPETLTKIKDVFDDFKRNYPVVRNLPQEPLQISSRRYEEEYPTDLTRLSMSFKSVRLLHPDLYALDVLAKILGQGRSSRLYLNVYKDEGLVHSISASNYTPMDKGIFGINSLLEQENIEAAIASIWRQINGVKTGGVRPEELEKAKQQVRTEYVLNHKTTSSVAYAQALDEAFTGDYLFSKKYVDGIGAVTVGDIKRVAKEYLSDGQLTTVVLKPKTEKAGETEGATAIEERDIQKYTLENGLTVLLKEDHTFPLIDIRLAANGGVRQETVELNGLFSMMASSWTKGTKRYSADKIAEMTESLGMQVGGFSGRNSFGIGMEFLTEHLPVALDLLKELIVDPVFPEKEIEDVKENMRVAIRARDDSIFQSTAHALKETLFLTHPFRLEQDGTIESIDRITRDDLKRFYKKFVVPGNMVLSVFGDIDSEDVLKDIKNSLGGLKGGEVSLIVHEENPPSEIREKTLRMDKEQAMVMLGFHGLKLADEDRYGLEVLTEILGSSFSGRLFVNIRAELGGAYTLGGNSVPGPDAGFVYFYVLTTEEGADNVKGIMKKEIEGLQSELVSEKELTDVKTYLKGMFKASLETGASLSFTVSLDELYGLGYKYYQGYDARIDSVTREDIRRLAQEYLDLSKTAIIITKPQN